MQSRTAFRNFSVPEGDHLTLLNIYRASDELLEKSKVVSSQDKAEKKLRKWCKQNFINSRSLKHARDIHRSAVVPWLTYSKFILASNYKSCTMVFP